jgi:hypothetical protein
LRRQHPVSHIHRRPSPETREKLVQEILDGHSRCHKPGAGRRAQGFPSHKNNKRVDQFWDELANPNCNWNQQTFNIHDEWSEELEISKSGIEESQTVQNRMP